MLRLADWNISKKLVIAFTIVSLIGGGLGAYVIHNMGRINDADTLLYKQELLGLSLTKEANVERLKALLNVREAILATSKEERDEALKRVVDHRANAVKLIEQAGNLYASEKGRTDLKILLDAWNKYQLLMDETITKIRESELLPPNQALQFLREVLSPESSSIGRQFTSLSGLKEVEAKELALGNNQLYLDSRRMSIIFVLAGVLLGLLLGVGISKHVKHPLAKAVDGAQAMSKGDMSMPLESTGSDETAQLLQALDLMRIDLQTIVSNVRTSSFSVATSTNEIALGNGELSARTEDQASALQQIAATMDELSSTVRNNAENAKQAELLAHQASQVANEGGEVVRQVVQTMRNINSSSKKISEIISVIDGIAFQTRILALNAAVEAARAGKEGLGFAVVAGEVGSLAQRSAEAAKAITILINEGVDLVTNGTVLVDQAGVTMNDIVVASGRVKNIIGEISAASAEQSSGIAQVGDAITEIDSVTQKNSALVEECAAAAESLKQQAVQLVQLVSVFKLN